MTKEIGMFMTVAVAKAMLLELHTLSTMLLA